MLRKTQMALALSMVWGLAPTYVSAQQVPDTEGILHDINHAMLGFDRLLLIKAGKLVGDIPCSVAAVPALEALYGISLSCVSNSQGDIVITPLRKSERRSDRGVSVR